MKNKIESSIRSQTCENAPYTWMALNDIFPEEFYEEMLDNFPDSAILNDPTWVKDDARKKNGESTRKCLVINRKNVSKLSSKQKSTWTKLYQTLTSPSVIQAIRDQLSEGLYARFKGEAPKLTPYLMVMEDSAGYVIEPHTDIPNKVITVMFYLTRETRDIGTCIYADKEGTLLKRLPFVYNSGLCFVVNDKSWHGVPKLGADEPIRRVIVFNLYLKNKAPKDIGHGL